MKILPFLIFLLFSICVIFFASNFNIVKAEPVSQKVIISTYIDEHLSYSKTSEKLIVSTNNPHGFLVLSYDGKLRKQNYGPSEQILDFKSPVFIMSNW